MNKNTRTISYFNNRRKKRHKKKHTHTRTLFTNNNAERGIVCSQERRRRARASERYDQTMRGDARRERWFCYIKSYLIKSFVFCVLYLGLKNLVTETRALRAHTTTDFFKPQQQPFETTQGLGRSLSSMSSTPRKFTGLSRTPTVRFFFLLLSSWNSR